MWFRDRFLVIEASGLLITEKTVMDGHRRLRGKGRRTETALNRRMV